MMAANALKLTQNGGFSLQTELQVHNEWRGCSCDGEVGKHEFELRVEVEMEWVASVPTACSVLDRLTRLELKD